MSQQVIKEMGDPTLKIGDIVRLRLPPKFAIENPFRIINSTCIVIDDNELLENSCST